MHLNGEQVRTTASVSFLSMTHVTHIKEGDPETENDVRLFVADMSSAQIQFLGFS